MPSQAVILTRISDARNGDERGVTDQLADCRRLADRLGWQTGPDPTHVVTENDVSAYKRRRTRLPDGSMGLRTDRPKFRRILDLLGSGAADGLIVYDLDRLARDPRDLEDLIDVVESRRPRLPVESVSGSLRLAHDGDVTMARILVAVANKSSRDTGRRVSRARERAALNGAYAGGRRPFGYEPDGKTVRESEAAEIRAAADALLAGVSLRQVTASLRDRGVPTVTGAPWNTRTVADILTRPRNAGLAVHQQREAARAFLSRGEPVPCDAGVIGRAAWPPVLDEATWRALCALLADPARRTSPGNRPRWLGSLLYRCGICGETLWVGAGRKANPTYLCRSGTGHLRRVARPVDDMVTEVITRRLALPDAAGLLATRTAGGIDTAAAARDANAARARLAELASMYAAGSVTAAQLATASAQLRDKLTAAETALAAVAPGDPLAGLAGRPDAATVWASLDLGRRRAILSTLLRVTVMPMARRGRQADGTYFDPASIRIEWRDTALS